MNILSAFVFVCLQSSSYGGISRTGNPLSWRTAKPVLNSVRQSGIKQFIYHYNRSKNIETPLFLWGDEIEYGLFGYDPKSNRFDLSLRGRQIREQLSLLERGLTDLKIGCEWQVHMMLCVKILLNFFYCCTSYYTSIKETAVILDAATVVKNYLCRGKHYHLLLVTEFNIYIIIRSRQFVKCANLYHIRPNNILFL